MTPRSNVKAFLEAFLSASLQGWIALNNHRVAGGFESSPEQPEDSGLVSAQRHSNAG
jgi:hypothetical protein